ncbi:MAG: coproporphyrinogen III oxidase family protein [Gemmatimonadetes bacterium]|nr:coproporphyrinogen III oxidase family protein [Gemmatimonadota bacterium]
MTVDDTPPVDAWLDAISAELRAIVEERDWPELRLSTLYVGGGTPSLLGTGAMAALANRLRAVVSWDPDALEWTAEANPERFDDALAKDWAEAGVSRVSFGAQTFDPDALRWMGRLHGPDGPGRALRAARAAGIPSISLDLIFGLPARFARDWTGDLDRALSLEPDHISLYGLTAEKNTPLGRWVEEGREQMPDEESYAVEYLEAADRFAAAGFEHYEVSNFARPGHASRHNRAYWTGEPYLGIGPGAHSFIPPRRWWNVRDWVAYRVRVGGRRSAIESDETVRGDAARLEHAWLGLRTAAGLDARDATQAQLELAASWRAHGWAYRDRVAQEGRIRLTPRGWLLLDRLAVEWETADATADAGPPSRTTASVRR